MITAPFFVVVLLATLLALKTRAARAGSTFLGLVLGLTLASTTLGPPILAGVNAACQGIVTALSSMGDA